VFVFSHVGPGNDNMDLINIAKRLYWNIYFFILTKKSKDGVEYVFKRRKSDRLLIVFSSMVGKYNFVRALNKSPSDQLFIRDCWADNASYYWYEHKNDYPERYTQNLIDTVIHQHQYKEIVTLGSSKGGTAAIYFGLKNNVSLVFAGACQYRVGDYLSRHQYAGSPKQWEAVVGEKVEPEWVELLDQKLERMIGSKRGSKIRIKLIFSTEEHTYQEHIVPLIQKLDECCINHEDQVERFKDHSNVGYYFKKAIMEYFNTR